MTTQKPEALRLADELDAEFAQGRISNHTGRKAATELRRQHARIAELEAHLSSSGFTAADMATASAQGFRDGVASVAASAGSEPVAWLVCTEEGDPDMVFLSQHEAQQYLEDDERPTPLYAHPSPTEGMAGWKLVPVEPTEEMLAAAHDGDREYTLRNFGDVMTVMQGPYDHWAAMIDAAPPPPTTSAGSGKGGEP